MELETANKVLTDSVYISETAKLAEIEKNRIFCRHDTEHFLNVARITLIMCMEMKKKVNPDIVYTASLLHDIGRLEEYQNGTPHDIAGVKKARYILERVGCNDKMKQKILSLIESHRSENVPENSLEDIFRRADKKSRMCFCCNARSSCFWSEEKRNMKIEV